MGSKNFKNQNRNNYNQYAKKAETDRVKEETVEEVTEPVEEAVEEVTEPVEEAVEEVTESIEETVEEVVEKVVEPIPEPKTYGVVNCSKLNVRKGPSIHSNPLCIVESGTKMEIETFNDEWVKVVTPDDVFGYCMKKFIDLK